jgi:hypothetical protein
MPVCIPETQRQLQNQRQDQRQTTAAGAVLSGSRDKVPSGSFMGKWVAGEVGGVKGRPASRWLSSPGCRRRSRASPTRSSGQRRRHPQTSQRATEGTEETAPITGGLPMPPRWRWAVTSGFSTLTVALHLCACALIWVGGRIEHPAPSNEHRKSSESGYQGSRSRR